MIETTALSILVSEAEPIIGPFREKYTPPAITGLLAHITLVYPFKPTTQVDTILLSQLKQLFASYHQFEFSLRDTGRFPNILYLAPWPDTHFRELTQIIIDQYPETFEGKFSGLVPHLTVVQGPSPEELDKIEKEFSLVTTKQLPIATIATEVWLFHKHKGSWYKHTSFALGSKTKNA